MTPHFWQIPSRLRSFIARAGQTHLMSSDGVDLAFEADVSILSRRLVDPHCAVSLDMWSSPRTEVEAGGMGDAGTSSGSCIPSMYSY